MNGKILNTLGVLAFTSLVSTNAHESYNASRRLDDPGQWCQPWSGDDAVWSDGYCWSLNVDTGPWCPDWSAPGRESNVIHRDDGIYADGEQRGWDPCCYSAGCDISFAYLDDSGVWRSSSDDSEWTEFIYDDCPCNDGDYNCNGGKRQVCTYGGGSWEDWTNMEQMCQDNGKPVCYAGFINAQYDNGACLGGHEVRSDNKGQSMCWPIDW